MKYQKLGWDHLIVSVPTDWSLIFDKKPPAKKKIETGFIGFRDSSTKRLEISWAIIKKKPPEPKKVLGDLFKTLKKDNKGIKIRNEGEKKVNAHNGYYIYWDLEKGDSQGYLLSWVCHKTQRVIICASQYQNKEKDVFKPLITEIMTGLICHSEEKYLLWSAPNLNVYTPAFEMNLLNRKFLIGLTFLELSKADLEVYAYRIGLANQKIDDSNKLPEWFPEYAKNNLPNIPSNYKPTPDFSNLVYKKKIEVKKLIQCSDSKMPLKTRKGYFETYLWLNQEKNDIYCIIFRLDKQPESDLHTQIEEIIKYAINFN
ncbi:MAG: hypothetical protein EAX86_03425 [Candidatus Heimdallarchaeota archaeon]|nr:hypothetical protein [Candidatus Heimdallarchaeota archaeon]